jgi:uncharacterized Zn-binding protein involved in type VI secretion
MSTSEIRHSIVASIPACHAGDRGSIPRVGGQQSQVAGNTNFGRQGKPVATVDTLANLPTPTYYT